LKLEKVVHSLKICEGFFQKLKKMVS